ncbi:MAG: two-component regulator propeller domain-containing protein [Flavobacteriales bacterium]
MRSLVLLAFLFPWLGPLSAQGVGGSAVERDEQLLFTAQHYGVEAGLPHRTVTSIVQDDRGFLWLGTPRGLAQFDGYRFRVLTMANGLAGNEVADLEYDNDGMLWVLYKNGKLDILESHTGRVESIQEHFAERLPEAAVGPFTSIAATQEGDIVFTGEGLLFRFQGISKTFGIAQVDCAHELTVVILTNDQSAWCTCNTSGVIWTDVDLLRIPLPQNDEAGPTQTFHGKGSIGVNKQLQDLSGWRPAQDPGFYFRTPEGMAWAPTEADPFHSRNKQLVHVGLSADATFIMPLREDAWLVNTTLRRMNAGDDPYTAPLLYDLTAKYPEASFFIETAVRDRTGNLWLGSEFGLYKINMRPSHFQHMLRDTAGGAQPGYRIRGMVVNGGRLHVNTEVQGYWVLDAATGAVISSDRGYALRRMMNSDGKGGVWRVAGEAVLHEDASGKVDRTISGPAGIYPPWSGLELKNGGFLIGTSKGLRIASAQEDTSVVCLSGHPLLDQAWVWHLMYHRNEQLLACTNAGLFRLNEHGRMQERWWSGALEVNDTAHYLPTDDIRNCYVDQEGIFWLATYADGLLRWDRSTGEVRKLGSREGIPATSIHAVLPDEKGALWLPSDNGLVRYDPKSGTAKTFTTNDGLPSNEFNRLAYAQGLDGRFYLGGLNGIVAFHPADLRNPTDKPMAPLVIEGVHKQRAQDQGQEDLSAQVLRGEAITMYPSDRFFTVDMVLLSYEDPSLIQYAWRIEGIDEAWNLQQEPRLRINTLPYGDHRLRIKAMDAEGRWTEAMLTIPIIMVPPFHLQWWFILGLILLGIAITFLVVRYKERQLMQVIRMRDHIASDLHDEVGSTLSSIVLFSSAVGKQTSGISKEAMGMLKRIKDNSTSAMESMNDIVWSVNSDNDAMENLFHRMRTYAQPLCDTAGIDLEFHLGEDLLSRKLGMEQRKNLYLVFKEAVSNAVKHSGCSTIIVHFRQVAGALELLVLDNGTGISLSEVDKDTLGGNGLGNMSRRAMEIGGTLEVGGRPEGGTQVRLHSARGGK